MEPLSEFLKSEREKKGIRLEEIASITKIHLHSLQLLEKGSWKELPPEPFIRGFIVAYSKYVGLNAKDILERYRTEVGEKKGAIVLPTSAAPQSTKNADVAETIDRAFTFPVKKIVIGAGAVVGVVLIVALISLGRKNDETLPTMTQTKAEPPAATEPERAVSSQTESKPEKSDTKTEAKPEVKADAKAEAKAETKPEAKTEAKNEAKAEETVAENEAASGDYVHTLSIEAKDRTWVKIVIDEAPPIQYFLQAEGKAEYKAKNKIKLVLGNATGTTIKHNGEVTEGRKLQGTIRSYIYPKDAKFPQDIPVKRDTTSETPAATTEKTEEKKKISR